MLDKFHEECGVAAIYGHPEASKLAYLSLYALQHRGQESAGISTSDGERIHTRRNPWGTWRTSLPMPSCPNCPARWPSATRAIRPPATRSNATPSPFPCSATRAASPSRTTATSPTPPNCALDLEARGSIFQASSDTEVILHLVAHSREKTLAARCAMRCCSSKALFPWSASPRTASSWPAIRKASGRSPWDSWNSAVAHRPTSSLPKPARST
jgi:amidophosphoribosyltransferase